MFLSPAAFAGRVPAAGAQAGARQGRPLPQRSPPSLPFWAGSDGNRPPPGPATFVSSGHGAAEGAPAPRPAPLSHDLFFAEEEIYVGDGHMSDWNYSPAESERREQAREKEAPMTPEPAPVYPEGAAPPHFHAPPTLPHGHGPVVPQAGPGNGYQPSLLGELLWTAVAAAIGILLWEWYRAERELSDEPLLAALRRRPAAYHEPWSEEAKDRPPAEAEAS